MDRRAFLTFIGLGAIGAATCIEPPGPLIDPEMAVALPDDIQRIPTYMEPAPEMWTKITDPPHTHGVLYEYTEDDLPPGWKIIERRGPGHYVIGKQ